MWSDFLQLFKPLKYLCITNTRRGFYQIFLPLIITIITILLIVFLKKEAYALDAIISRANSILVLMIPFNITALAAIATFQSPNLDSKLSGNPIPFLNRKIRGQTVKDELTRRRYLCFMFGYMSLLGIIMFLMCMLVSALAFKDSNYWNWTFITILSFLSGNYLINTLLGLFYLSDRIHRND